MNPNPSRSPATTPAPVDPWSWHRRTLTALRARLVREATEHRHEADELLGEARDDHGGRVADDNEIETLLAEAKGELRLLEEVDAALTRLEAGRYGLCEETGKSIPAERLRALPWARLTREAAARRERDPRRPLP
jgi:DnaK suppressor protein